jgi:hypothetical protein
MLTDPSALIFLAAPKLSIGTLLLLGAFAGLMVIAWAYSNWRAAIKMAIVVALLEGGIRKWVFPSGQELVYFLKDGILLGAYLRVLFGNEPEFRLTHLKLAANEILILCIIIGLGALNPNFGSPLQGLFGLKMYFMYLPLVFIMPRLFRSEEEAVRQLTWFLWIAVPICLLGLAQWKAGPDSILNVYANTGGRGPAGFGFGEKVRITGTFSYIAGHSTFLLFFTGLSLALLSEHKTKLPWLIVATIIPLLLGNTLMNGARSLVMYICVLFGVFAFFGFAGQVGQGTKFRAILIAGAAMGVIVVTYLFVDAYFYLSQRFLRAGDSVSDRTTAWHTRSLEHAINGAGVFGYGLGITFPASGSLAAALQLPPPRERPPLMESEPGQIWMETGPLGFLSWFGIRAIFILACVRAYGQARTPFQRSMAILAATISVLYLIGQIVGNHTGNILIHALIGLALVPLLESTIPLPRTTTRNLTPSLPPPNPRSSRVPRPIRSHNSPPPLTATSSATLRSFSEEPSLHPSPFRHSPFAFRHSSFVIRHSPFVIRLSSFVIRHSTILSASPPSAPLRDPLPTLHPPLPTDSPLTPH